MNIVKFKDVEIEGDYNFNSNYKGKYCWWVNCKWAVLFDNMNMQEYIEASQADTVEVDYLIVADYANYIDEKWTEKINNEVNLCIEMNEHIDLIPLDKLKVFRTWLAQSLINITADTDEYEVNTGGYGYKIDTMLNYYASNKMDATTVALANFANSLTPIGSITTSKCACSTSTNILTGSLSTSTCDPLAMYHTGIYNTMVETFSNVEFWMDKIEFCMLVKRYLEGILQSGLKLQQYNNMSNLDYCDCVCVGNNDAELVAIVSNLIKAFGYIIEGETLKHKNFIYTSLFSWASKLYEMMYWV